MPGHLSRLIYRKPHADDLPRLFAIFGDPRTNLFNPAGPLTDLAEARYLLERWLQQWSSAGYGWWAIAERETPAHIIGFGGIGTLNYLSTPRVNLGYRFAVEAWGQGYATEVGRAALALAFDQLRLPEVFGLVRPDHAASIRVLQKIGMQPFGQLDDVPGQAPSLVLRVARGFGADGARHPTTA